MQCRALLVALSLAVVSCQSGTAKPDVPAAGTRFLGGDTLEEVQPVDIAVALPRDQSGVELQALPLLRGELYQGLVDRLYTPLELGFVDANWREAGFDPAALDADAVLAVAITKWDTSRVSSLGAVFADVEVLLRDGSSNAAAPLWGVTLTRKLDLGFQRNSLPSALAREERAMELLAQEILVLIPERDPLAEPRTDR